MTEPGQRPQGDRISLLPFQFFFEMRSHMSLLPFPRLWTSLQEPLPHRLVVRLSLFLQLVLQRECMTYCIGTSLTSCVYHDSHGQHWASRSKILIHRDEVPYLGYLWLTQNVVCRAGWLQTQRVLHLKACTTIPRISMLLFPMCPELESIKQSEPGAGLGMVLAWAHTWDDGTQEAGAMVLRRLGQEGPFKFKTRLDYRQRIFLYFVSLYRPGCPGTCSMSSRLAQNSVSEVQATDLAGDLVKQAERDAEQKGCVSLFCFFFESLHYSPEFKSENPNSRSPGLAMAVVINTRPSG